MYPGEARPCDDGLLAAYDVLAAGEPASWRCRKSPSVVDTLLLVLDLAGCE